MTRTMLVSVVLGMMTVSVAGEWKKTDLVFCTLSQEEYMKCMDLAEATARDQALDDRTFGSYYRPIRCTVPYISPEDCMKVMTNEELKKFDQWNQLNVLHHYVLSILISH